MVKSTLPTLPVQEQSGLRPSVLDDQLSGRFGKYRIDDDHIRAHFPDDMSIVTQFLDEFQGQTKRSYTKEVIRFWKYVLKAKNMPLSSVSATEMESYVSFLQKPDPAVFGFTYEYIRKLPRKPPTGLSALSDDWWPFRAGTAKTKDTSARSTSESDVYPGLSNASIGVAMNIISSMFAYFVSHQYTRLNPVSKSLVHKYKSQFGRTPTERYLEKELVELIFAVLNSRPVETESEQRRWQRDRMILYLYYFTGIRRSEGVASPTINDLTRPKSVVGELEDGDAEQIETVNVSYPLMGQIQYERDLKTQVERCFISILGKGDKRRLIPIPDPLKEVIHEYRLHKGLSMRPTPGEQTPLVMTLYNHEEIGGETVANVLREVFTDTAHVLRDRLGTNLPEGLRHQYETWISKLEKASPHWLRHSRGSALHSSPNVSLKLLADFLGHANISTTNIYLHSEKNAAFDAINESSS